MNFICDKYHFIFSHTIEPKQCSACGEYTVRMANETERQRYEKCLKELPNDQDTAKVEFERELKMLETDGLKKIRFGWNMKRRFDCYAAKGNSL